MLYLASGSPDFASRDRNRFHRVLITPRGFSFRSPVRPLALANNFRFHAIGRINIRVEIRTDSRIDRLPLARLFREPTSEWSGPRRRSSLGPRVPMCESHLGPETRDSYQGWRANAINSRWHNRYYIPRVFFLSCLTHTKEDIAKLAENCKSFRNFWSNIWLMW